MPKSYLDQLTQIAASASYDDAVASAHSGGVAEAQTELEGDLNVFRTNMKDHKGVTNWFDEPSMSTEGIATKYFMYKRHESGFDSVSVNGGSTTGFDTAIKTISGHNDGGGNSTTGGVIVNTSWTHKVFIRDATTGDPIDDGSNNEVYGKLSYATSTYTLTFYSDVAGSETAYSFGSSTDIDMAYAFVSSTYKNLPWVMFLNAEFHDTVGPTGTIADDNVDVDGMSLLYNGLTTQAQVNVKGDKLGSTANGEGASGIAIEDASTWYSGTDTEAAFNELESLLGSTTSSTYSFSENNILSDNDPVYAALNKLDLEWGDLASVSNGEGAAMVGSEDAGGFYAGTDVEAILQEIGQKILDVSGWIKETETAGPISSGVNHTLPGSLTYTPANGDNLDVYDDGQLQLEGAGNDYQEVAGAPSTQIKFNYTVGANTNLTYMSRK